MPSDVPAVWAKANYSHPDACRDFLKHFASGIQHGGECSFAIGPLLTKKRKPYLVCGIAEQFFVFSLSKEQAKVLGAVKDGMVKHERRTLVALPSSTELPILVSKLEIENKSFLKNRDPIAVRCHYELQGEVPESIAACLQYDLHGRGNLYTWVTLSDGRPILSPPNKAGVLDFRFPPIYKPGANSDDDWTGTTAAFFRFFSMPDRQSMAGRSPLSHPAGTLIDVIRSKARR